MRIGLMGGTFDPPHLGHLVCADEAAWKFELDEVWFVPAGDPWHKDRDDISDPATRLELSEAAVASNPRFRASDIDVKRPGPTYTFDTLNAVAKVRPNAELYFITGADALATILKWHRADELFELATFVAATRPGTDVEAVTRPGVKVLDIPALAISSTDIRARVSDRRPWTYLVPPPVAEVINKRRLYRQ